MTEVLTVLPIVTHDYAQHCVASIRQPRSSYGLPLEDVLVVDNTRDGSAGCYGFRTYRDPKGHNLGVARSWNIGAREVMDRGIDYLLLLSASMLFGPELHCTWEWQMREFWGQNVIEADGHSWHLIAFHRRVFERIGLFDSNFFPAYFEAIDFGYRMRQVGWEGNWTRCWVNAMSQGSALHNEVVSCPADPLLDYYAQKWGGKKGEERWTLPFGDRPLDFFEDVPIPVLAERYGLETWW